MKKARRIIQAAAGRYSLEAFTDKAKAKAKDPVACKLFLAATNRRGSIFPAQANCIRPPRTLQFI